MYLVFHLTEFHQAIRLPLLLLVPSADTDLAYSGHQRLLARSSSNAPIYSSSALERGLALAKA